MHVTVSIAVQRFVGIDIHMAAQQTTRTAADTSWRRHRWIKKVEEHGILSGLKACDRYLRHGACRLLPPHRNVFQVIQFSIAVGVNPVRQVQLAVAVEIKDGLVDHTPLVKADFK